VFVSSPRLSGDLSCGSGHRWVAILGHTFGNCHINPVDNGVDIAIALANWASKSANGKGGSEKD
jgi:hypothetical protein